MNKNLLRVIVYGAYFLIVFGLLQLVNWMIPYQTYRIFTAMGIVRYVIDVLIMLSGVTAARLILRKYGAQIAVTSPRAKKILWAILIFLFFMLLFGPYLFFNGNLPFSVFR